MARIGQRADFPAVVAHWTGYDSDAAAAVGCSLMQSRTRLRAYGWSIVTRDDGNGNVERRCWDCERWLPLVAFYRCATDAYGYGRRCRSCRLRDYHAGKRP